MEASSPAGRPCASAAAGSRRGERRRTSAAVGSPAAAAPNARAIRSVPSSRSEPSPIDRHWATRIKEGHGRRG